MYLFKGQLNLSDDIVCALKFERCHRVGNRSIIVRFPDYKDKMTVWDAQFKLTGHKFSVSDNVSRITEFKRRKLLVYAINKKAKIFDKYKKKTER